MALSHQNSERAALPISRDRMAHPLALDGPNNGATAECQAEERDRNDSDEPAAPKVEPAPSDIDWRDPVCWLQQHASAPKVESTRPASLDGPPLVVPSLETLLHRLVRRVAWAGDGRSGTIRLEFGAGELEGSIVLVHAQGRELSVEVELCPGLDARVWRARIAARLSASGLQVRDLDVH